MHGRLHGSRSRRRPGKTWLDTVKRDCSTREVTFAQAGHLAKDRDEWRKLVFRLLPKRSMDTYMESQRL